VIRLSSGQRGRAGGPVAARGRADDAGEGGDEPAGVRPSAGVGDAGGVVAVGQEDERVIDPQLGAPLAMAGGIPLLAAECVAPPLLHRILDQGSPLIEAWLLDPDGLKATVTELENGPYSEDPWLKLVEVITLDRAARAFLP
jgi:hypothetical protein